MASPPNAPGLERYDSLTLYEERPAGGDGGTRGGREESPSPCTSMVYGGGGEHADRLRQLRAVFDTIDRNGDGSIDVRELLLCLRKNPDVAEFMNLPMHVQQEGGTRETFEQKFQAIDKDGSRDVTWAEFQAYFSSLDTASGAPQTEGGEGGEGGNGSESEARDERPARSAAGSPEQPPQQQQPQQDQNAQSQQQSQQQRPQQPRPQQSYQQDSQQEPQRYLMNSPLPTPQPPQLQQQHNQQQQHERYSTPYSPKAVASGLSTGSTAGSLGISSPSPGRERSGSVGRGGSPTRGGSPAGSAQARAESPLARQGRLGYGAGRHDAQRDLMNSSPPTGTGGTDTDNGGGDGGGGGGGIGIGSDGRRDSLVDLAATMQEALDMCDRSVGSVDHGDGGPGSLGGSVGGGESKYHLHGELQVDAMAKAPVEVVSIEVPPSPRRRPSPLPPASLLPPAAGPTVRIPLPPSTLILDASSGGWVRARIFASEADGRISSIEVIDPHPDASMAEYFCIPGLIDTHVHLTACTADLTKLTRMSESYIAVAAAAELRRTLRRGFTTVRDAGGADYGLARASAEGLIGGDSRGGSREDRGGEAGEGSPGPRVLFVGHAVSQTGGHGDMRGPGEDGGGHTCGCCAAMARGIGVVADGVDECRRVCRDELRKGAHAIKIMAGGGVASPTDRLEDLQFSEEEIRACVDEAERRRKYVMAHAYTAEAISRAVKLGVRSIEHGNYLDDESAKDMAAAGAALSQTIITYVALRSDGERCGMPADLVAKVGNLVDAGLRSVAVAQRHGVPVTYGTDLLGDMRTRQLEGFGLLLDAGMTPREALATATGNAAALLGLNAGAVRRGLLCDLVVVNVNPLTEAGLRGLREENVERVFVGGRRAL